MVLVQMGSQLTRSVEASTMTNCPACPVRLKPNWPLLKPYTVHIHVKDAVLKDKKIVPAGQGDGDIGEILKDFYASGYRGFLTLEPHLGVAGQFSGFTGPKLFKAATDALKDVCRQNGIPLAGS